MGKLIIFMGNMEMCPGNLRTWGWAGDTILTG